MVHPFPLINVRRRREKEFKNNVRVRDHSVTFKLIFHKNSEESEHTVIKPTLRLSDLSLQIYYWTVLGYGFT